MKTKEEEEGGASEVVSGKNKCSKCSVRMFFATEEILILLEHVYPAIKF